MVWKSFYVLSVFVYIKKKVLTFSKDVVCRVKFMEDLSPHPYKSSIRNMEHLIPLSSGALITNRGFAERNPNKMRNPEKCI